MPGEFAKRWGTPRREPLEVGAAVDEATRQLCGDPETVSGDAQEILRQAHAAARRKEERLAKTTAEESP